MILKIWQLPPAPLSPPANFWYVENFCWIFLYVFLYRYFWLCRSTCSNAQVIELYMTLGAEATTDTRNERNVRSGTTVKKLAQIICLWFWFIKMEKMIDGDIPWEEEDRDIILLTWEIFFWQNRRKKKTLSFRCAGFFPPAALFFFKTLGHHTRFPPSIDQSIDAEYIICTLYYLT